MSGRGKAILCAVGERAQYYRIEEEQRASLEEEIMTPM